MPEPRPDRKGNSPNMTAARNLFRCSILSLFVILIAAPQAKAGVEPRVYLAWHAPYGMPRAADNVSFSCGDGGQDTLFMTYQTGADTNQFSGMEANLNFRVPAPDSLGSYWRHLESVTEVEFLPDSTPGCTRAWRGSLSLRFSFYDVTNGIGRLQLSHMRPPTYPVTVRDSLPYFYARVILPHPPASERCDQPLCLEWSAAQFIMDTTAATSVYTTKRAGHAFVTINSPKGAVCESFLPQPPGKKPEVWHPKPDPKSKPKAKK